MSITLASPVFSHLNFAQNVGIIDMVLNGIGDRVVPGFSFELENRFVMAFDSLFFHLSFNFIGQILLC